MDEPDRQGTGGGDRVVATPSDQAEQAPLEVRATAWLAEALGEGVAELVPATAKDGPREPSLRVRSTSLREALAFLRDDPRTRFDFLANLTAIDWPARQALEVIYHLVSYPHGHELAVRVDVPRDRPSLSSVVSLYPVADWLEREQYDLLGVVFEGHPDLRRILMPDDWTGFPLRKDYVEGKSYRGMPTSRPSPIDLLLHHDRVHAPKPIVPPRAPAPAAPAAGGATGAPASVAEPGKEPSS
jgi:NADH-quinone oxidoreductase subunit C